MAALVIAGLAVREGIEAWRGDACCAAPTSVLTGERSVEAHYDDACCAGEGAGAGSAASK